MCKVEKERRKVAVAVTFFFMFIVPYSGGPVGCGKQAPQYMPKFPTAKSRIINGNQAVPYSWPWQVRVEHSNATFSGSKLIAANYCGGTVLRVADNAESSDMILTAAHCVTERVMPPK